MINKMKKDAQSVFLKADILRGLELCQLLNHVDQFI
jgi:hypothetical protein